MTTTLVLPRLSKARPDHAGGLPARITPKPSLFTRLLTAVMEQRQRQADQHIARYI